MISFQLIITTAKLGLDDQDSIVAAIDNGIGLGAPVRRFAKLPGDSFKPTLDVGDTVRCRRHFHAPEDETGLGDSHCVLRKVRETGKSPVVLEVPKDCPRDGVFRRSKSELCTLVRPVDDVHRTRQD